jgi:hypothetical protein
MNGKLQTIIPVWHPLGLQIDSVGLLYYWYPDLLVNCYNFWTANDF